MEPLGAKIYTSIKEEDSNEHIQVYKKNGIYTVDLNGVAFSGLQKKDDVIEHLCKIVLFLIGVSKNKNENGADREP